MPIPKRQPERTLGRCATCNIMYRWFPKPLLRDALCPVHGTPLLHTIARHFKGEVRDVDSVGTSLAATAANQLARRFVLGVSRNGAVAIFDTEANKGRPWGLMYLPVYSTDTLEDARHLQVLRCRLSREDNATYFLNEFSGEVDDLARVGAMFAGDMLRMRERDAERAKAGRP